MRFTYFLLCSLFLSACGIRTQTESNEKAKSPTIQEQPKKDNWQRTKECAEQAERMAKRPVFAGGSGGGEITVKVIRMENHYSPKYERCYLQVFYLNSGANKSNGIPLTTYELIDAFEGKLLSDCTDASAADGWFCNIQDSDESFVDCRKCRQFVKDRMTN